MALLLDDAPTIWMNVTTSTFWNRPPVGIVRVEQELRDHLAPIYGNRFKSCVWLEGQFYHADSGERLWRAAQGAAHKKQLLSLLEEFPATRAMDRRLQSVPLTEQRSTISGHSAIFSDMGNLEPASFRYGDVLITVGLDWDQQYTSRLRDLRAQHGIKIVTCCYDLIPVLFPQYCVSNVAAQFKEYFTKLTWASDAVLCISERSRRDYLDLCADIGAPDVETAVIRLGDHIPDGQQEVSDEIETLSQQDFILFVSTIERRKNHEVLYRAYHILCAEGRAKQLPKLVFVGMPGWGVADLLADIQLDPLTNALIVQLNRVNDAELALLYRRAKICAYPSLYEGWGLPVGEALAMGKAVISSNRGSLKEVGGDLVVYADPWNPREWADRILELVEHPERIAELERRAVENYLPATWRSTAHDVAQVIEALPNKDTNTLVLRPGYDLSTFAGLHWGSKIRSIAGNTGILAFGPHQALPGGRYEITVHYEIVDDSDGGLRIAFQSDGGARLHSEKSVSGHWRKGESGMIALPAATLTGPIDGYEIVVILEGAVAIDLEAIHVDRQSLPTA